MKTSPILARVLFLSELNSVPRASNTLHRKKTESVMFTNAAKLKYKAPPLTITVYISAPLAKQPSKEECETPTAESTEPWASTDKAPPLTRDGGPVEPALIDTQFSMNLD
jgi:hypothetical protein